jgi:HK97 family phage major capsid protein
MSDNILTTLNNEAEQAANEAISLAEKGDADGAKAALEKANSIKTRIEVIQSAGSIKSWQNGSTGNGNLPQAGAPEVKSAGKVGETHIDLLTGNVVEQKGAGVLTNQQVTAIHNPDFSEGFKSWVRAGGNEAKMRGAKAATDAFREGVDSEGGHFVPAEIIAGIIRRDPTPTRIVDHVRTISISSDQAQMVKANYDSDDLYSSAVRIYKTGEAQTAAKSPKPQFGLKRIDVHGWTGEISVSNRLLEDNNFDIMGYFAQEFRTATRNMIAQKILLGSGIEEHFGILTLAAKANSGIETVKSGDANLLTWDSLRKIKNKVPEQYDNNCRYIFNKKSTLDTIEGFKDVNGRDLWPESQRAGGIEGAPGRLRGYGYSLEAFMPDIIANAYPLLFGDFSGYARVFRAGMTIKVLSEIEARNSQTVFLVEMREGGDVIEPWKLKALKIAA